MKLSTLFSIVALSAPAIADQAPRNTDNQKGTVAVADFPTGNVVFYVKRGNQVKVHVDITALPESGGPFQYHIHEFPVPAGGNCDATGGHLNPFNAPADCDNQRDDSYCQVGDLSGKHGWIDTTCFETKYYDPYLSLTEGDASYVVGRSVVFHYANMTRFACANIELVNGAKAVALMDSYKAKGDLEFQDLENDEFDLNELSYDNQESPLQILNRATSETEEEVQEDDSNTERGHLSTGKVSNSSNITTNGTALYDGADIELPIVDGNVSNSSFASVVTTDCEDSGSAISSIPFRLIWLALLLW